MRGQISRFMWILFFLGLYTANKASQLWPAEPAGAGFLGFVLFALMISGMFIHRRNPEVFEHGWFRLLSWCGSLLMAFWATWILISVPFDLFHLLVRVVNFFAVSDGITHASEVIFAPLVYRSIFIFASGLMLLGFLTTLLGPKVKKIVVTEPQLPLSLDGLKIVQISDLHIGATIRSSYVEQVVKLTNDLHADLIVLTGDIVDSHADSVVEHMKSLRNLKSKYGVFYVTGNHEYYWGAKAIVSRIQEVGIKPLLNANQILQIGNTPLMVAGVTDPAGGQFFPDHAPNMQQAVQTSVQVEYQILLAHRPDACLQAEGLDFDLQFSGHTHAGQFFPFSLFIGLEHKYSRGLYRHGKMWVYVNPGTGYWGPANRLGVRTEISSITLKKVT